MERHSKRKVPNVSGYVITLFAMHPLTRPLTSLHSYIHRQNKKRVITQVYWDVYEILDIRVDDSAGVEYHIKWAGDYEPSWLPHENWQSKGDMITSV